MVEMVLSSSRDQSSSVTTKSKSTIQAYESVIESLQSFINEDNLSSMAYNNGKSYYGSVLVPFVKASILLTEAVSEACQKFVDTYCTEVDSCDLDSDRLERQIDEAKMRIAHLESIRQDIALKDIPDYAKEQQLMYNDKTMEPILSMKKDLENKLEKLLEFEATSPEIFSNITDLKAIVDKGKAQTDVSWNGGAFVIPKDLSWTNTVTDKWKIRLDEIEAKEEAYHSAKRKELEGYNVYAWPYQDPLTKEVSIMWFIDKDGVRIFDKELQGYVEKYGKDLEGIYEIVGWDKIYELDLAARRKGDGKNYLTENQIPEGWQGYSKVGAYVDSAYWYAQKTGLLDLAMMVGLSYAATKSQMKGSTAKNVENVLNGKASAFGEMSSADAARYNKYWNDVAAGKTVSQRLGIEDVIRKLKPVGKQPYQFHDYNGDPSKEYNGAGKISHPNEWNTTIDNLKNQGVEVVEKANGTMGYSPKTDFNPSQLNIDGNSSYSALMHEQQHYLDDLANGFKGWESMLDTKFRLQSEFNAYMTEIKIAEQAGNKILSNQLFENYIRERNKILGR